MNWSSSQDQQTKAQRFVHVSSECEPFFQRPSISILLEHTFLSAKSAYCIVPHDRCGYSVLFLERAIGSDIVREISRCSHASSVQVYATWYCLIHNTGFVSAGEAL